MNSMDSNSRRSMHRLMVVTILVAMTGVRASADYVGVSAEIMSFSPEDATTYRFYLHFDDPDDALRRVGGISGAGAVAFRSDAWLFNEGGAFSGQREEDLAMFPISDIADSWVTIGADNFQGNETRTELGFICGGCLCFVIYGPWWQDGQYGWFDSDPSTPVTPDKSGRILIAQFTVPDYPDGRHAAVRLEGFATWTSASGEPTDTFFRHAITDCPSRIDLDQSGTIDFGDVLLVLAAWGPCDGCTEDIDGLFGVGHSDLLDVLAHWGACP